MQCHSDCHSCLVRFHFVLCEKFVQSGFVNSIENKGILQLISFVIGVMIVSCQLWNIHWFCWVWHWRCHAHRSKWGSWKVFWKFTLIPTLSLKFTEMMRLTSSVQLLHFSGIFWDFFMCRQSAHWEHWHRKLKSSSNALVKNPSMSQNKADIIAHELTSTFSLHCIDPQWHESRTSLEAIKDEMEAMKLNSGEDQEMTDARLGIVFSETADLLEWQWETLFEKWKCSFNLHSIMKNVLSLCSCFILSSCCVAHTQTDSDLHDPVSVSQEPKLTALVPNSSPDVTTTENKEKRIHLRNCKSVCLKYASQKLCLTQGRMWFMCNGIFCDMLVMKCDVHQNHMSASTNTQMIVTMHHNCLRMWHFQKMQSVRKLRFSSDKWHSQNETLWPKIWGRMIHLEWWHAKHQLSNDQCKMGRWFF